MTQKAVFAPICSIRGKIQHRLASLGLDEADALAVTSLVEGRHELTSVRFADSMDDYPAVLFEHIWDITSEVTDDWLQKHKPNHWARLAFSRAATSSRFMPC